MRSVALVSAGADGEGLAGLVGDGVDVVGAPEVVAREVAQLDATGQVRFVTWSFESVAPWLLRAGVRVSRAWDLAEVHRILHGGWAAAPSRVWAGAAGLDPDDAPTAPSGDLFDFVGGPEPEAGGDDPVLPDGHLRGDASSPAWLEHPEHLRAWARAALTCAARQLSLAERSGPRAVATAISESATAVLAAELAHDGLPIDRVEALRIIVLASGPRPESDAHAARLRAARDEVVLRLLPGGYRADLRNPAAVKGMLETVGVRLESTRKWELEAHRDEHPVIPALLAWRADERIATTYGHRWLEEHVGPDDRLRGAWTVCDGAAGRMTAQHGLHNLPAVLRTAVAAEPGHVIVRADLGQIEPRVLAVVAGDEAFADATRADDLYAPVAARLGVERSVAKVAVLAAMYGQRSGAAGEALRGLERAYPVSMSFLDRAYDAGRRAEPVRTFGGRLVRTDYRTDTVPVGTNPSFDSARGRFARNAVIQGSAAELFKAWASTVRATTRDLDAQIVLCLHDELLVHVPQEHAQETVGRLLEALTASSRRWSGSDRVRFVADVKVVRRWSEAKD
ncbi:MAG: DNA polymerase [Ornithinimicrobium sp.]|uniref:DNA polymerase n=1 Tax=Ornithinimicrobium sp. TaxID=1977084 RepID=UPI0026DF8463|nr:DNA polymerase [Ornithinimicrobium sp.]MDO5740317.1 DNA polymerase [Ornithinimicrobium sp.]